MIVGYFHQESFDVPITKIILKLYRILRTHPHHCSMVLEYSFFLMTSLVKLFNDSGIFSSGKF